MAGDDQNPLCSLQLLHALVGLDTREDEVEEEAGDEDGKQQDCQLLHVLVIVYPSGLKMFGSFHPYSPSLIMGVHFPCVWTPFTHLHKASFQNKASNLCQFCKVLGNRILQFTVSI